MAKREKKKIVSRKHLARIERERIQKRYITIISIAVIAAVVILIGIGFLQESYIKPHQPVATVNDTTITTEKYQAWIRFQRFQLVNLYDRYYQFVQGLTDPNMQAYFQSALLDIQSQLAPENIGLSAINYLVEDVLIREEAERLGITVSKEEVEKSIAESVFRYYPDGTPTPVPTTRPTSTLSPLQMTLVAPTPTAIITDTESAEPTPIPTEEEIPPTAMAPTPTVYTAQAYEDKYSEYLTYIDVNAQLSESDLIWIFEGQFIRQKVMDAVTADIPTEEEQVWVRQILVKDEETARDLIPRLEAGEDFAQLATDNSDDGSSRSKGGDLGWFGHGKMTAPSEVEEVAFSLEIGEISEPIQSAIGWHIIQVLGHEVRPLDENVLQQLRQDTFQEWLNNQRAAATTEIPNTWISVVPTEPDIPDEMKVSPPQ